MDQPQPPAKRRLSRLAALRLRCPRCGEGKLFKSWFQMHDRCEVCGLQLDRAEGFYLASIYINYGVTSLVAAAVFCVAVLAFDVPPQAALIGCLAFVVLFPLWFFRYARSLFLATDHYINPQREGGASTNGPAYKKTMLSASHVQDVQSDDAAAGAMLVVFVTMVIVIGIVFATAIILFLYFGT